MSGKPSEDPDDAKHDLGVDAAPVVFSGGGDRLVVDGNQGSVDDPRPVVTTGNWPQSAGQQRHQMADGSVHCGLAGGEQDGQRAGGQVGAQVDQYQQHPHSQRQRPRAAGAVWQHLLCGQVDGADLAGGEPGERHQASVSAWE